MSIDKPIEGMCFDCGNLTDEVADTGYSCCDYSENMACPLRKEDGSCWVAHKESDKHPGL